MDDDRHTHDVDADAADAADAFGANGAYPSIDGGAMDGDAAERLIAEALSRVDAAASPGPVPDAARVAAHLAGVGDAALLDEAAERPDVRRLLSEIAAAASDAESDARSRPALSRDVRERAIAAFVTDDDARSSDALDANGVTVAGGASGAEDRPRRGRLLRWSTPARAAAAIAAVAASVALLALPGRAVEASPVLSIDGIDRLDLSRGVDAEGVRALPVGRHIAPGPREIVSVRLAGGSRVVLGAGDDVRVACDGGSCRRAALALDRGGVLLSASSSAPVPLLFPGGGRLDVLVGDARVGHPTAAPAVALRAGARAVWTPADGTPPSTLSGPSSYVLGGATPVVSPASEAALESLFLALRMLGDPAPLSSTERVVYAPQWRILGRSSTSASPGAASGEASPASAARVTEANGLPAIRFDVPAGGRASLAWRPDPEAAAAGRLEVLLRLDRPRAAKGGDAPGAAPRLTVELDGVPGAIATPTLPSDPSSLVRVVLPLPTGLDGSREAVLRLSCEGAPARVWFEGTALRADPSGADTSRDPGSGGG